jgi:hypothetical protein
LIVIIFTKNLRRKIIWVESPCNTGNIEYSIPWCLRPPLSIIVTCSADSIFVIGKKEDMIGLIFLTKDGTIYMSFNVGIRE